MFKKLHIKNAEAFIETHIPGGEHLVNFYVNGLILEDLRSAVKDMLHRSGWLDLSLSLPTPFEPEDIDKLVSLADQGNATRLMADK